MNKKRFLVVSVSLLFAAVLIFVICPIFVKAAISQTVQSEVHIIIETINSEWSDKNGNKLSSLPLPEYVSPGQNIDLNGGIFLNNIGVDSYARIKFQSKLNDALNDCFFVTLNENWIKGNDEYYYYCNTDENGVIYKNQRTQVIEELQISTSFKNSDKDSTLSIVLTLEVVDSKSTDYVDGWGSNPPQEWFDCIQN